MQKAGISLPGFLFVSVLLFQKSCFHIVTLFRRFPHGEGLAGQCAIIHYGGEQLALFHIRQEESCGIGLLGQFLDHINTVDIIHLASQFLQHGVNGILQRAYSQLHGGFGYDKSTALIPIVEGDDMLFASGRCLFRADLCAAVLLPQFLKQSFHQLSPGMPNTFL